MLATLSAICLPGNSSAQTPPDDSAQSSVPDALPADILPSSPLAEVVKLTRAGVSENVILSYITNSSDAFNLNSEKIIYLTNLGTPDEFVTAMMQHDQTLAASGAQPAPPPATADTTEIATQPPTVALTEDDFDNSLTPYGNWVEVEGYGRCWRPTATFYDTAWQPYSDHGHWIYTDAGWYWASDYAWGATFHYGRWFHHDRFGWCWYPDTVWAPSWVTWRYSDDYCGWAPLPPGAVYREGVGIFYNGMAVGAGFDFGLAVNFFTFVPTRDFCDPHPSRFRVAPLQVTQIYNRTTVINNFGVNSHDRTFVNSGIPPQRITAVTHAEIHPIAIRETTTTLTHGDQLGRSGNTLFVNRPHFTDHPNPSAPRIPPAQNDFSRPDRGGNISQKTSQNNFQRPPDNHSPQTGAPFQTAPVTQPQSSQSRYNAPNSQRPADQNPQPNRNPRAPQNYTAPQQTDAPVVRSPQTGTPVQNAPANGNNGRNGNLNSPNTQQQSPAVIRPAPEMRVIITPPQQPQMNSAPRVEQQPANDQPANPGTPPATQNGQPRGSSPGSQTPSGQQKSGRDKNQNGPGN